MELSIVVIVIAEYIRWESYCNKLHANNINCFAREKSESTDNQINKSKLTELDLNTVGGTIDYEVKNRLIIGLKFKL